MTNFPTIHGLALPNPVKCVTMMTEKGPEFDIIGGLKYVILSIFTVGITAIVDLCLWGVQKISGCLLMGRVEDLSKQAKKLQNNKNLTEEQKSAVGKACGDLSSFNVKHGSKISKIDLFNQHLHAIKAVASEAKAASKKT